MRLPKRSLKWASRNLPTESRSRITIWSNQPKPARTWSHRTFAPSTTPWWRAKPRQTWSSTPRGPAWCQASSRSMPGCWGSPRCPCLTVKRGTCQLGQIWMQWKKSTLFKLGLLVMLLLELSDKWLSVTIFQVPPFSMMTLLVRIPQCGNFRIFLSLRFYVNSIEFKNCNFCNFIGSEFCSFGKFQPFKSVKIHKNQKSEPQNVWKYKILQF